MLRSLDQDRTEKPTLICNREHQIVKLGKGEWQYPWKSMQIGDAFKMMIGSYPTLGHIKVTTAQAMRRRAEKKYKRAFILCWVRGDLYCFRVERPGAFWHNKITAEYGIADARVKYPWRDIKVGQSFDFPLYLTRHSMRTAIKRVEKVSNMRFKLEGNRVRRIK